MDHLKWKSLFLVFLLSLCWGPSFLFYKVGIETISPFMFVFMRMGISFLVFWLMCAFQGENLIKWRSIWKSSVVLGLTLNVIPFSLFCFGELYISSALAGILNGLNLIFTAVIAHFFGPNEKLTSKKILGIGLGLMGLFIIYAPLLVHENLGESFGSTLIIFACLSYSIGGIYAKTHLHKAPSHVFLTWQCGLSTLMLLPPALFFGIPFVQPSLPSIASALGISLIGTVAAYLIFYKTIKIAGPTYANLSVLMCPIFAIILGVIVLSEEVTWNVYLGTLFILTGVSFVNPVNLSQNSKTD